MEREKFNKKLEEKFNELSELFDNILNEKRGEERKCL